MPNPSHVEAYDALAEHIRAIDAAELVFVPSPGNWGDSLINAGSREFFDAYSIDYREVRRERLPRTDKLRDVHVVIGGGGGWCRFWHTTPEFVAEVQPVAGFVTVLPTSFADAPVSPSEAENLKLFSRGRTSLERQDMPLAFCHDMAFHCSAFTVPNGKRGGTLRALRTDVEGRGDESHTDSRDLSLEGDGFTDPRPLYHEIGRFTHVTTDRLHIGIAAAQLGLDVELLSSGCPKIEGVCDLSMKSVFPNVHPRFERN